MSAANPRARAVRVLHRLLAEVSLRGSTLTYPQVGRLIDDALDEIGPLLAERGVAEAAERRAATSRDLCGNE